MNEEEIDLDSIIEQIKNLTSASEEEFFFLEKANEQLIELDKQRIDLARKISEKRSSLKAKNDNLNRLKKDKERLTKRLEAEKLDKERLKDFEKRRDEYLATVTFAPWLKENRSDGKNALPHQIDGAFQLASAKRGLLADVRGLGKTLTSLIYSHMVNSSRTLFIVPLDVIHQFQGDLEVWTNNTRSIINLVDYPKAQWPIIFQIMKESPELICLINTQAWMQSYDTIDKLIELQFDTVIIDEAHMIKSQQLNMYKGVDRLVFAPNQCPSCRRDCSNNLSIEDGFKICDFCGEKSPAKKRGDFSSVKNFLAMTGTPILNRPQEIFPLLHLIDPDRFSSLAEFLRNYCVLTYGNKWTFKIGGQEALLKSLGPRIVRRDRKSAGVVIPPQTVYHYEIEPDKVTYRKQYEAIQMLKEAAQLQMSENANMTINSIIALITRLRQANTWPNGIRWIDPNTDKEHQLEVLESQKLDWAREKILELMDEGEAVVVFSQFKEPLRELQRLIGDSMVLYTGDTPKDERVKIAQDFHADTTNPKWQVIGATYQTAGIGLTLTRATQIVILDRSWNPGTESQAMGRVDRIGTTRETAVHILTIKGTIDDFLDKLIESKDNLVSSFVEVLNSL